MEIQFDRLQAQQKADEFRANLDAKYPPRLVYEVATAYRPVYEELMKPSTEKRFIKIEEETYELLTVKEIALSAEGFYAVLWLTPVH